MYLRVVGFKSNSHLFKGLNSHRNHLSTYSIAQEFQVAVTVTDFRAASKSQGENENTWGKKRQTKLSFYLLAEINNSYLISRARQGVASL